MCRFLYKVKNYDNLGFLDWIVLIDLSCIRFKYVSQSFEVCLQDFKEFKINLNFTKFQGLKLIYVEFLLKTKLP